MEAEKEMELSCADIEYGSFNLVIGIECIIMKEHKRFPNPYLKVKTDKWLSSRKQNRCVCQLCCTQDLQVCTYCCITLLASDHSLQPYPINRETRKILWLVGNIICQGMMTRDRAEAELWPGSLYLDAQRRKERIVSWLLYIELQLQQ